MKKSKTLLLLEQLTSNKGETYYKVTLGQNHMYLYSNNEVDTLLAELPSKASFMISSERINARQK